MTPEKIIKVTDEKMAHVHSRIKRLVAEFVEYPEIEPDRRFNCYPLLFSNAFLNVTDDDIEQLSFAFRLGWEYVSISDMIFDTPGGGTPSNVICSQLFFSDFLRELQKLFTYESPFWKHYNHYLNKFSRAILTEIIKIRYGLQVYSYPEFKHCSANKIAFGKIAIAGLATLNGTPDSFASLAKSHDYFYIAAQLRDDLIDWLEDYNRKMYTFLIRRALLLNGISHDDYFRKWPQADEMERMIWTSDVVDWVIRESKKYFLKAHNKAETNNVPAWLSVIEEFLQYVDNLDNDVQKRL